MASVREVLGDNGHVVSPTTPVSEVAQMMARYGLGIVPVCERGRLRGLVTGEQIVSQTVASGQDPKRQRAGSVMITDLPKVSAGSDVLEAAQLMARHKLRYLPVVQNGRYVGVVSMDDLAKASLAAAAVVIAHNQDNSGPARVKVGRP